MASSVGRIGTGRRTHRRAGQGGCTLPDPGDATATVPRHALPRDDRRCALSRRALGPIALIGALLLLVGAAVVFFVLAVGLVRDTLSGSGDLATQVEADLRPDPGTDGGIGDTGSGERPAEVPADAHAAIVERIVDGDTLRVVAPPGVAGGILPDGGSARVRLLNVDAPELARDGQPAECLAEEATGRLAALVAPGDLVWLAADAQDADRFDRLLRAVWTEDGEFVNEVLAAEGFATAVLVGGNDRFHPPVVAAQERARDDGLGVWGEACADR
jgi:micrococcal nuclease